MIAVKWYINTITDLCNLFFIVGFMIAINGKLTLLCMCGLPVLVFVVVLIKRKQHKSWQIQSNKQSNRMPTSPRVSMVYA